MDAPPTVRKNTNRRFKIIMGKLFESPQRIVAAEVNLSSWLAVGL